MFTVADLRGLLLQGQWTVSLPQEARPGDAVHVAGEPALEAPAPGCGWRGGPGETEPAPGRLLAPGPLLAEGPFPWRLVGETAATLQLTKPLELADGATRGTLDLVLSKSTGRLTITASIDDRSFPGGWRTLVLHGGPPG